MVQKNGGCSHMTCIQCKYEYCWHCRGNHVEMYCTMFKCSFFAIFALIVLVLFFKTLSLLVYPSTPMPFRLSQNPFGGVLPHDRTFSNVLYYTAIIVVANSGVVGFAKFMGVRSRRV